MRPLRPLAAGLVAATAGLLVVLAAPPWGPAASPAAVGAARVLDRHAIPFREDAEPGRVVAEVEARVEATADGVRCVVHASATGPRVHAAPGPLGVHGGNRITAEELAALVARDGVRLRARGGSTRGPAPVVTRGQVIERRLGADGRVTHGGAGPADGALGVELASGPLGDGTSTLEVVADGRVRVRCVVRVDGAVGRVVHLAQLDEHGEEVGS